MPSVWSMSMPMPMVSVLGRGCGPVEEEDMVMDVGMDLVMMEPK